MSELRERRKPASEASASTQSATPSSPRNTTKEVSGAQRDMEVFKSFLESASNKVPAPIRPYYILAIPYVCYSVKAFEKCLPYYYFCYKKYEEYSEKLVVYRLELLLPSLAGFILCFFGGEFLTIVAAVEAYRQVGYETTYRCIHELIEDYHKLTVANKADNSVDADNDGVADVNEISKEQLVMRKTLLFLRTIDPAKVTMAIGGIQTGILAVIATLKMHFAKAITLGNAIGQVLEVPTRRFLVPVMRDILPDEYENWAETLMIYIIHSIAISVAWTLQRFISAFHSAIRGGLMFSRNIMEYTTVMKIYEVNHDESILDEIIGYGKPVVFDLVL
jgi:hypothetical protein